MRYLPHTDEEIVEMLDIVGAGSLEALFKDVPDNCRRSDLDLPEAVSEWALDRHMDDLAARTSVAPEYQVFMGAGRYHHYIPAMASYLSNRSEFATAYTPYQPEISQGTLQAIYEYQTLAARLMGVEVSTASHYDGATALAEALLMAIRITRRTRVAISQAIHPLFRRVVQTYFDPTDYEIIELPYLENGRTDISPLQDMENVAAIAIQSPNFFGCIEDLNITGDIHAKGALFIAAFTEPLAYGLFKSPGSQGADIVCGEGQSLGIPISFGGPGLGMLGSKSKFVRNLPGRLVGRTRDIDGQDGFVLTLATREQHIRREKATSNICTNNSLCALAAVIYMASLGGTGFRHLAQLNYDKAQYLKNALKLAGFKLPFEAPCFNEFVVEFPPGFEATYQRLLSKKVVAGLPLVQYYPELPHHYLLCATETISRADMDMLVREVQS